MAFPMTSSLVKRSRRLIEVWPGLADDVKAEILKILTLAGLRPDEVDDFNDVTTAGIHAAT